MSGLSQGKNGTGTHETTTIKRKEVIVCQIKLAFWVPIYLKTLVLFCWLFGTYSDPVRVTETIIKGTKVTPHRTHKAKGITAILGRLLLPFSHIGGRGKSL